LVFWLKKNKLVLESGPDCPLGCPFGQSGPVAALKKSATELSDKVLKTKKSQMTMEQQDEAKVEHWNTNRLENSLQGENRACLPSLFLPFFFMLSLSCNKQKHQTLV